MVTSLCGSRPAPRRRAFRAYSGVEPLPAVTSVRPFRSATECTVSPRSTMYSTPSVLMASAFTPPWVLLYSTLPRLAGTAAMSSSPFTSSGTISSGAAARVKS